MRFRLSILAALAAFAFALTLSPSANAQTCPADCIPWGGGGSGGNGGGDSTSTIGEPFNPFKRGTDEDSTNGNGGPGNGNNPGGPQSLLPGYVAGLSNCKTSLDGLPRVTASAIRKVEEGVSVFFVCANRNLIDQQEGVESIRGAVKQNAAMKKALRGAGAFSADDVVAVVLNGEGAKLYVHRARDKVGSAGGGAILQIY
jgi:hypothetical protein